MQLVFSGDPSGRLLKYNPQTKETTVLHRSLQFPNGVSMSKDGSFYILFHTYFISALLLLIHIRH
jgi:sugar lactone lactonase YvrE